MLEWRANETLAVGKGATLQQYVATVGSNQLEMEIAHINDAKDRRQAFRAIRQIAERYVETHMNRNSLRYRLKFSRERHSQ